MRSIQRYIVPLGDAISSHLEIYSPDAELEIDKVTYVKRLPATGTGLEKELRHLMGVADATSTSLHHYYTTRHSFHLQGGSLDSDEAIEHDRLLHLRIRTRTKRSVRLAYTAVALGVSATAGYSLVRFGGAMVSGKFGPALGDMALLVSALTAILILFAENRHRHPVVQDQVSGYSAVVIAGGALVAVLLIIMLFLALLSKT